MEKQFAFATRDGSQSNSYKEHSRKLKKLALRRHQRLWEVEIVTTLMRAGLEKSRNIPFLPKSTKSIRYPPRQLALTRHGSIVIVESVQFESRCAEGMSDL
jgi:hypothetical protein